MKLTVMGGSISGLAAALTLAADGHQVTLVERDRIEPGPSASAFTCSRRGVPHFYQPHAFLPRGRNLLLHHLPAVYNALLEAGAIEVHALAHLVPQQRDDDEAVYLAARRPLIEWALRRALDDTSCAVLNGSVTGLLATGSGGAHVRGVRLSDGSELPSDLVIDATGRTTPVPSWLNALGAGIVTETAPVGCVYYSRYFRLRPGATVMSTEWPLGPRGNLGFGFFATFPGDNHTFGIALMPPVHDHDLRILQRDAAFTAACNAIPPLARIFAEAMLEPVTPVMPMGALQNTLHHYESARVTGLLPIGDTFFHTDPTFALGLSNALIHATELTSSLRAHPTDLVTAASRYLAEIYPEAEERFRLACTFDDARTRGWKGERFDIASASSCYPLFSVTAAAMAGQRDPAVLRAITRRMGYLDRCAVFDNDHTLHDRVEQIVRGFFASGPLPSLSPPRNEFVSLLQAAAASATPAPSLSTAPATSLASAN